MEKQITEKERILTVRKEVDVLVVGGGPTGLIAAQAAAEGGAHVLLIDNRSFLGGNMTIGLPVLGFLSQKKEQIIKGLPDAFIRRLRAKNAASEHRPCPLHMGITMVEPEAVKTEALAMMVDAGVEVMLYTYFVDVVMEGNILKGVIIETKAGRQVILARTIIDCTGDGDVAFRSGVPTRQGDENGGVQPSTLMFCMGGVDTEKLRMSIAEEPRTYLTDFIPNEYFGQNNQFIVVGLRSLMAKGRADGFNLPTERTIIITGLRQGEAWINMSAVSGVNGVDPDSLTFGEIKGREQVKDIQEYLIKYVPGFKSAYFTKIAPFLGIRETRTTVGEYVMTGEDILGCRRFEDVITVASYPLDLHHPQGGGCTLEWCGDCYDIPYRSLLPLGVENLLVAGRCTSATHEAMSSTRVMATCMALGEAAGRAAAQAVQDQLSPRNISVQKLQKSLLKGGAYLGTDIESRMVAEN